jgi:hypothetical protein
MSTPTLAQLQRWMAEMPGAFLDPGAHVEAVVADLFETAYAMHPSPALRKACAPPADDAAAIHHARWILAACHLLWHDALRVEAGRASAVEPFLVEDLASVAAVVDVERLRYDEERTEELIRRALRALGQSLPGESERDAADRLKQVDVVERESVLRQAELRAARAREVRAAMRRKAAEEAAAKVCRE